MQANKWQWPGKSALIDRPASGPVEIVARLPRLTRQLPRWAALSCLVFWVSIIAIILFSVEAYTLRGLVLLGAVILLSSLIVIYLMVHASRTLENEFSVLGDVAGQGEFSTETDLQFAETERIADAIRLSRRTYRDEIEVLQRAAFRDAATGLPNVLSLTSALERALPKASYGNPAAYFHLRLEGFARATDILGASGSQLLQNEVSARLSLYFATLAADEGSTINDVFFAALGPGELAAFLPTGCGRQEASQLARELRLNFEQPFEIDGRTITVNISGGISMAPDDGDTPQTLMKNAAMALDEILRAGKSGFQFFTPRLERLALGRHRFEQELRDAVSSEAFKPVFQPKISFQTGEIIGAEALARWYRGEGRTISPGTFIPLAEELGLIDEIGFQILREACRAAAGWMKNGHEIAVAVNVAPSQFERKDFIDQVVDALRFSGLPPRLLELEITETMAVSSPDRVIDVMQPLRAMGIKLAIDDFGTGHANLSMLTQLPFDIFKIDRQFVSALEEDTQAPAIVEMILAMAETLGLETVAEGVETEAQAAFLRRRGCTLGQGFLFSRGIPDDEFTRFVADWRRLDAAI